jgi:hypothetical protein
MYNKIRKIEFYYKFRKIKSKYEMTIIIKMRCIYIKYLIH